MMNKVLLIGIDSLAPELLEKYSNDLPNFTRLRKESPTSSSESVFPVDSIPAWSSIYTGWNPAKHGIVYSFDIFDSNPVGGLNIDVNIFKGKTFWDYVSDAGKNVCVVFPFLAYPSWKVNGIMVSKSTAEKRVEEGAKWLVDRTVDACPPEAIDAYRIPPLMRGVSGKHPGMKDIMAWADEAKKALYMEFELALKICQDHDWDLSFVFFGWLDVIQHRFWRYSDEKDPTYPGNNPYSDVIKEFYQVLDSIVGKFIELYPEATLIVFSDHGHGIRPSKTVNINEILRGMDLLFSKGKGPNLSTYLKEVSKTKLLDVAYKLDLEFWLVDLSTRNKSITSLSKSVYASASSIDMEYTVAYLSSFAGIKSYSHGGIEIKKENLNGRDYEEIRNQIIENLEKLRLPHCDEKLVKWVCRREDLYKGPRVSHAYPDIVFELEEGYGTNWSIYVPLIGTAYDHKLAPGGHKKKAVFLVRNPGKELRRKNISIIDIAPTILDLMDLDWKWLGFDGESIFE